MRAISCAQLRIRRPLSRPSKRSAVIVSMSVLHLLERVAEILAGFRSQLVAEAKAEVRFRHALVPFSAGLDLPDDDAIVHVACQTARSAAARYTSRAHVRAGKRVSRSRCWSLTSAAGAIGCSRPPRLAADLVITHASIWTGNPAQPSATAVAIIGDRIVDVGGADEIERWRGANTTVVDAEGRRLVPGFNDAHVRFVDGGTQLDDVDLKDADTAGGIRAPHRRAREGEAGRVDPRRRLGRTALVAGRAADSRARSTTSPTRRRCSSVRYDGRMALANAAALGRAGITERTPDPPGGAIVRDAERVSDRRPAGRGDGARRARRSRR